MVSPVFTASVNGFFPRCSSRPEGLHLECSAVTGLGLVVAKEGYKPLLFLDGPYGILVFRSLRRVVAIFGHLLRALTAHCVSHKKSRRGRQSKCEHTAKVRVRVRM